MPDEDVMQPEGEETPEVVEPGMEGEEEAGEDAEAPVVDGEEVVPAEDTEVEDDEATEEVA